MTTVRNLFFKRVTSEWKYQYGVWRTVIDWTVALYIVIPALLIGGWEYISWWTSPPNLPVFITINFFIALLFLISWQGSVRVFLEEADQLFLWQQKGWIKGLYKYGLSYSLLLNILINVFGLLLFAPFLLLYFQQPIIQLSFLLIWTILFSSCLKLVKNIIMLRIAGLKQRIILGLLFITSGLIFNFIFQYMVYHLSWFVLGNIVLLIILRYLVIKKMNLQGVFFEEVAREQAEKLKYVNFILGFSGLKVKKPIFPRKKPIIFGTSNILFKKRNATNAMTELCLKSVLRNGSYLWQYWQMVVICTAVIFTFPPAWKVVILAVLPFILTNFVRYFWQEAVTADFVQIYPLKFQDKLTALGKFMFLITLPGFILISFIVGFQLLSWLGAIITISLGGILLFYASKLVASLIAIG